jgi:hypothetical protein
VLIAIVAVVCVVLLVLAFLVPRLSHGPQRGADKTMAAGQRGAGKAPGLLGRWFQKPFSSGRKAQNKSAAAGRKGRGKLPM